MSSPRSFIIQDVRVFTGQSFIEHGYVAVSDGTITAVGSGTPPTTSSDSSDTPAPVVISKPGHTLIPGLIDAHVHTGNAALSSLHQSLNFGVTTVCELSNAPAHIKSMLSKLSHEEEKANSSVSPSDCPTTRYADYVYAGSAATCDGGWPDAVILAHNPGAKAALDTQPKVRQAADAPGFVQQQLELGARLIKMHHETGESLHVKPKFMPQESRRAVVAETRRHGLPIVAHALSYRGTLDCLRDGVSGMAHMFMDAAASEGGGDGDGDGDGEEELLRLYRETGAHCNPTLSLIGSITTEGKELQAQFAQDPLTQRLLVDDKEAAVEHMCRCLDMGNETASVRHAYATTRKLHKAGVPLIVGSDATTTAKGTAFGLTVHQEMWLLAHEIGLTPVEVLKAATSVTAERLGLRDRGSVSIGSRADLVLVQGDFREALGDNKNLCLSLKGVWSRGRISETWKECIDV